MDLDRGVVSISWEVVDCSPNTASEVPIWDVRGPAKCAPFEKPINVYLNGYAQSLVSTSTYLSLTLDFQPLRTNLLVHPAHRADK